MNETPLEKIIGDLHNCSNITIKFDSKEYEWTTEFEYDRCDFSGRGNTPEEALLEAMTDKDICDYYYAAEWSAELTQEQMQAYLVGNYHAYLNKDPDHEYRGDYAKKDAPPPNPRQAANRLILEKLAQAVESQPDSRFWQILMNLDVLDYLMVDGVFHCKDPWNEESRVTLNRMEKIR